MADKEKKITMQQIAEDLHLSRQTVSTILNGNLKKRYISPETEKKVRDYVRETGFHQNLSALSLRGKYSKDVAIITSPFIYPHHRKLYFHLMDSLNRRNISFVTLFFSPRNIGELLQQINLFNFSKIIFIAYDLANNDNFEAWNICRKQLKNVPVFYYDYPLGKNRSLNEFFNNESAGAIDRQDIRVKGIPYLSELGYRKIIVPKVALDACVEMFKDKNLIFDSYEHPYFKNESNFYEDQLIYCGRKLARKYRDYDFNAMPTAFLMYDDFASSGMIREFRNMNLSVPGNLGIISWGYISEIACDPEICSWIFPHKEMFKSLEKWLIAKKDYRFVDKFDFALHKGGSLKQN